MSEDSFDNEGKSPDDDNAETSSVEDDEILDDEPDEWVKKKAAAEQLGVNERTIRRWDEKHLIDSQRGKDGELYVRLQDCFEVRRIIAEGGAPKPAAKRRARRVGAADDPQLDQVRQAHRFANLLMEPNRVSLEHMMRLLTKSETQVKYWEERCRGMMDKYEHALSVEHERKLESEDREVEREAEKKRSEQKLALLNEGMEVVRAIFPAVISRVTGTTAVSEGAIGKVVAALDDQQIQALINSGFLDQGTLITLIELRDQLRKAANQNGKATAPEAGKTNGKANGKSNGQNGASGGSIAP